MTANNEALSAERVKRAVEYAEWLTTTRAADAREIGFTLVLLLAERETMRAGLERVKREHEFDVGTLTAARERIKVLEREYEEACEEGAIYLDQTTDLNARLATVERETAEACVQAVADVTWDAQQIDEDFAGSEAFEYGLDEAIGAIRLRFRLDKGEP